MKGILLAAALAAAACGPKRTTAASQPTPAAFDATKSDPKALATVDAGLTALGGYDKWTATKELHSDTKHTNKDQTVGWYRNAWDRWNGRHLMQMADPATLKGAPEAITWLEVRYDIYDAGKLPYAAINGNPVRDAEAGQYVTAARQVLNEEAYKLLVLYKLRDPGVHLADAGESNNFAN